MSGEDFKRDELLQLIAEVCNGTLDEPGREKLNTQLKASEAARRFYREHMELHARLVLDYGGVQATDFMPGAAPPQSRTPRWSRWIAVAAAAAAIVLAAVLVWPGEPEPNPIASPGPAKTPEPFASLEAVKSARWKGSGLPTTKGSRLGVGSLTLAEGLATLRFDSGAKVVIEGPAELTLVDAMQFRLASGKAFAEIPESAQGFRIATPAADVVDHGTRFSVIVDAANGDTQTQLYDGRLQVKHLRTGKDIALEKTGQFIRTTREELGEMLDAPSQSTWPEKIGPLMRGSDWTLLETVKDAYIGHAYLKDGVEVHRSETLLLVKNGPPHRKAYLGFDLAGIDAQRITDAELTLDFAPTGWGLASLVPDTTFSVYGLLTGQSWDEQSLDEENAPANIWRSGGRGQPAAGSPKLVDHEVRKLGSFLIEQGVQRGQFGIQGESLAAFLREHAGKPITLIVIRDTRETETNGLVHGFASRRHPTLPAPTLAIRLAER
ncbi:MAG: FecR domain-containing protein [Haloferula sp.]